jgi:signal transduction histidine kinase
VGFDPQRSVPGFGLKSMQQRAESIAAILQISSELNQGTEVRVMMPIETESR